jgi:UDP-N-acetylglucosamine--N-acetylmuramyl-(pentapeptide) pyrophosphoryl-undecaprenol N-acetylglucosamine transferase
MEMEKVPQAGYDIKGLWISGFQRKLDKQNLMFPFKLISSLMGASKIIRDFKPDIAIGTGGYASGPLLFMAGRKGVPTLILEQNSYPGVTTKLLAGRADKICVAYRGMEKYFDKKKIIVTGSPIRSQITQSKIGKGEACKHFGLGTSKEVLLIIGGSQGAIGINNAIKANLEKITQGGMQLLWQTGISSYEEAKNLVAEKGLEQMVIVKKFISRMDMAYAASTIVVSRSGAIALAEIVAVGKPAIFIPLPTAAEDHQTKNALTLAEKGAAVLVKEKNAVAELAQAVEQLKSDDASRKQMLEKLKDFETPRATDKIVDVALDLLKKK